MIFPALRESVFQPAELSADERHLVYRRMGELLDALGARTPVLLALDDIHWADEASVELLAFLLRRPPSRRVALALAYRRAQARHRPLPSNAWRGTGPRAHRAGSPVAGRGRRAPRRSPRRAARPGLPAGGREPVLHASSWRERRVTTRTHRPRRTRAVAGVPAAVAASLGGLAALSDDASACSMGRR